MTARHDQLACGTSTAGTGALTLAALPAAITGIDPNAAFSGNGWGTSQGFSIDYSLVEYTDGTFTQPKQSESGRGTLLLGANLAASTLTRTAPLQTVTGMDSPPATVGGQSSAASAINIGTAANVVIWFGLSSFSPIGSMPFFSTSGVANADGLGFTPDQGTSTGTNQNVTSQQIYYQHVRIAYSGLIKSCTVHAQAGYTGGTSSLKMALYEVGSSGKPGKQLIDFGSNAAYVTGAMTLTAAAPVFIPAGSYFVAILVQFAGGTGTPNMRQAPTTCASPLGTQNSNYQGPLARATVAGQTSLTDPATLTSLTGSSTQNEFQCIFRSS